MTAPSWFKLKILLPALLLLGGTFGFIYRQDLLVALGEYLNSERPLAKSDAIIVLSGGVPERILEAIDLYKAGYASRIVLTKGEEPENLSLLKSLGVEVPEGYEMNLRIASRASIPRRAITVLEPRIDSTYKEVELLRDYCLKERIGSLILVTSKTHTTRAYKIFNHLADGRISVIPHASRYGQFDPHSWWHSRRMAKEVLFEYQKLVHYYLIVLTGG